MMHGQKNIKIIYPSWESD